MQGLCAYLVRCGKAGFSAHFLYGFYLAPVLFYQGANALYSSFKDSTMKYLYLACLMAMLLSSCNRAKTLTYKAGYTFTLEPSSNDSLLALRALIPSYQEKYGRYDGVYLLWEENTDYSRRSWPWGCQQSVQSRYIVLQPSNTVLSTFDIETPRSAAIVDARITIVSPNGSIQTYTEEDLHTNTSEDGRTSWKVAYSNIQKGSLIETNYTIRTSNPPVERTTLLQRPLPCEKVIIRYAYPLQWEGQFKEVGTNQIPMVVDSLDRKWGKRIRVFSDSSNVPYKAEPYSPHYKEFGKYVTFMLTDIPIRDANLWITRSARYKSPETWAAIADHYSKAVMNEKELQSAYVKEVTEKTITNCRTDVEKLEAIVSALQQNPNIIADTTDGFADYIDERQKHPYLITGIAHGMLNNANISSEVIFFHSAAEGCFDSSYISLSQLPCPALYTIIDSVPYITFPYLKNIPIDIVPPWIQGQRAMRVSRDGYNGFMVVPQDKNPDNTVDEQYNFTVNEEGKVTVEEETVFQGLTAYYMREHFDKLKQEEIDKELKKRLTRSQRNVHLLSSELLNQHDIRKPFVIKLKYEIDNMVTITPSEVVLQTGDLFSSSSNYIEKMDTTERQNPINVPYSQAISRTIALHYPNQWTMTTNLQDQHVKNDFGLVSTVSTREANSLIIRQQRTLQKTQAPKERYKELATILKTTATEVPTLVFSRR